VTRVIIRKNLLERSSDSLHTYMNYKIHVENDSMYNTPTTFGIYIAGLVFKWLLNMGGLDEMYKLNVEKAGILYNAIDSSNGYYRGTTAVEDRSLMNVTYRLPNEELEKKFIDEAKKKGFDGLKGHRSVGGIRASIYNAFPKKGVEELVKFMEEFRANNQ
ncbi:MAG TPA: aminotransferase class V-fold PLP-dependent enzyme, partial [Ignavibacteriaceae bacterium]|nr:aminotransferase class V-fold PLP-dependent enzyme [Ignavibacteriaceae bacterium]